MGLVMPPMNCDSMSMPVTTTMGPLASGTSRLSAAPTSAEPMMVVPNPNRAATLPATSAPSNAPGPAAARIRPRSAGPIPSWRVTYSTYTANMALWNRFEVPVQPAIDRNSGLPRTTASPSRSSTQIELGPAACCTGGGSEVRMNSKQITDATNEAASTATASGAVTSWTSAPATPGPVIWATERLISSLLLPSTRCSRLTSTGKYDWSATSKNTVSVPVRMPTR